MEKLESIIFGLKAEVERLQGERNKYKELYETMYRKWSELSDKEFNCEALRKEKNEYFDKAVELQKQVDELENIGCHFNCPLIDFPDFECEKLIKERAVKDTAKEIQQMLHDLGGCDATDDWSKGWDKAIDTAYEAIEKRYGVEVE